VADGQARGCLFGEICMMRPEQDIISVITSLQSIAATCDIQLALNKTKDSPSLVCKLEALKSQALLQVKILEWVLGREPSL
jgi:hypothetical protein